MGGTGRLGQTYLHLVCIRSHDRLLATPWTAAHQAPLSTGHSRQEYWSGLPCPPPGHLPDPGIEPTSITSPTVAGGFFTTRATWEAHTYTYIHFLLDSIRMEVTIEHPRLLCLLHWVLYH